MAIVGQLHRGIVLRSIRAELGHAGWVSRRRRCNSPNDVVGCASQTTLTNPIELTVGPQRTSLGEQFRPR
jgi:hypothetical protein